MSGCLKTQSMHHISVVTFSCMGIIKIINHCFNSGMQFYGNLSNKIMLLSKHYEVI